MDGLQFAVLVGFLPFVLFFLAMMFGLLGRRNEAPASAVQEGRRHFCLREIGGHRHSSAGKSADQVAPPGGKSGRSIGDHVPLALAD